MINKENAKDLSKLLSQHLKSKEVKQSEILELISEFNGYKDWNTFSAVADDSVYDPSSLNWSKRDYIHVDNGGYEFAYNHKRKVLYINAGYFGYSSHSHIFSFSKSEIKQFIFDLEKMSAHHDAPEETEENMVIRSAGKKWIIDAFSINLFSSTHNVVLMRNKTKEIVAILKSYL